MRDEDWAPVSADDVADLGKPFVADGFLRLNKPALAHLLVVLGRRPGGQRDLTVLLGLMCRAEFDGSDYVNPVEGTVAGSDSELARLIGLDRKTLQRSVDELIHLGESSTASGDHVVYNRRRPRHPRGLRRCRAAPRPRQVDRAAPPPAATPPSARAPSRLPTGPAAGRRPAARNDDPSCGAPGSRSRLSRATASAAYRLAACPSDGA